MAEGKAVTLLDVAKAAQVSRATASLVVRNAPVVAPATRARVEQAMRDLGYVYNRNAAGLRSNRSGVIGILLPNIKNPFFAEFLEGAEAVLHAAGQTTFLVISGDDARREQQALRHLLERGCDGLVLCPAQDMAPESAEEIARSGVPVVQAMREISDQFDYVGPDYEAGMALVVEHLAGLGHRHLAFVTWGLRHSAARARERGLAAVCHRAGLPDPVLISAPDLDSAVHAWRAQGVSAVICFNDVIALQLGCALIDAGMIAGRDVSIVGFDGIRIAGAFRPRLTTVDIRPSEIGRGVAERLMQRIGAPELVAERRLMPVSLVPGQSTGPVKENGRP